MKSKKLKYEKIRELADKLYTQTFHQTMFQVAHVIFEGKKKYPKDDWQERPLEHHLSHIRKHLDDYEENPCFDNLEDLTHACTRIMMITTTLINNNIHDYGKLVGRLEHIHTEEKERFPMLQIKQCD